MSCSLMNCGLDEDRRFDLSEYEGPVARWCPGCGDHAILSSAQRLPNGNTLVCDGGNAHLFEVTPGKAIVWEFINPWHPDRASKSIYRCERYSPEYVAPLLDKVRSAK